MIDSQMTSGLHKIEILLDTYGIVVEEADMPLLTMLIEEVELYIKNWCNISEIPTELENVIVRRVCGKFMDITVKNSITEADGVVKAKTLGDTRIELATSTTDQEKRIDELINYGSEILYKYRRIPW